jgi:uncharacterized iron-regulated protein
MLAEAATADVVFLGEQHNDPNTHRLELAVLEGLMRRRANVILSLEMFERDVQEQLDRFAAGQIGEIEFLAAARPWPNYATDYKPLVDFAVAHKWPIVAANVPRPVASEVSKGGAGVLDGKSERERGWFAADRRCPTGADEYYKRFMEAMGSHPGSTGDNFYLAQCLKDETMAESIVTARAAAMSGPSRPLVVHVNGAFHSDFGAGTADRVKRRLPGLRVVIISMLPVENLDSLSPEPDRARGDYLVYTVKK